MRARLEKDTHLSLGHIGVYPARFSGDLFCQFRFESLDQAVECRNSRHDVELSKVFLGVQPASKLKGKFVRTVRQKPQFCSKSWDT